MVRRWLSLVPRFTLGRLMIWVAIFALIFLILLREPEGSFIAGCWIVGVSLLMMIILLYAQTMARLGTIWSSNRWRGFLVALLSVANAALIIAGANAVFLFVCGSLTHGHSRRIPPFAFVTGILAALIFTWRIRLWVANRIRPLIPIEKLSLKQAPEFHEFLEGLSSPTIESRLPVEDHPPDAPASLAE